MDNSFFYGREYITLRIKEKNLERIDIGVVKELVSKTLTDKYGSKNIKVSRIYKSTLKHRYFYIYLPLPQRMINDVIDKLAKALKGSVSINQLEIVSILNGQMEKVNIPENVNLSTTKNVIIQPLKKPKIKRHRFKVSNHVEGANKPIRVDIIMDDIEDFWKFLESREPNRQTRERYKEAINSLYKNGWNEYRHSTFINDNTYTVNAKDIRVFVNGIQSDDFKITVKEYQESLELYLSYRRAKKYRFPNVRVLKDESIPPVIKERPETTESATNEDKGKKIFAIINNLQMWESYKNGSKRETDNTKPSVSLEGGEAGSRVSATIKASTITEDDESVRITISLDQPEEEPSPEYNEVMNNEVLEDDFFDSIDEGIGETPVIESENTDVNEAVVVEDSNYLLEMTPSNDEHNNQPPKVEKKYSDIWEIIISPYKKLYSYIINLFK